jgi:hypothetical protein
MPMIGDSAAERTLKARRSVARDLAVAAMRWEGVPDTSPFRDNDRRG